MSLFSLVTAFLVSSLAWAAHYEIREVPHEEVQLLDFVYNEEDRLPRESYNRQKHFTPWIKTYEDGDCLNTRGRVLVRDSHEPTTRTSRGCSIDRGLWYDPYTDREFTSAQDIQIDHFVPLKHAYISGAHNWSKQDRCVYSNFMGNSYHLIPVYGQENSRKSDQSPATYMPPNEGYHCQYLKQWLSVKAIWKLSLSLQEKDVITQRLIQARCDRQEFVLSAEELESQRQQISNFRPFCRP